MQWLGLGLGMLVGASIWGWRGVIVIGFIGWLVGWIIQQNKKTSLTPIIDGAQPPRESLEARVARLERTVAELQARLKTGDSPLFSETTSQTGDSPLLSATAPAAAPPIAPTATATSSPAPQPVTKPATPATPPEPPKPNPIVAWFTGGNTIMRVGLVILFFGMAFLLKYAADHSMLPVELRVAAVAAGGIALLVIGWRLRDKRRAYALGMQGGGVAVLYLATFSALKLWHLIPAEAAFFLLALIAVFAAILAILQDAMALAVIGAAGGFLAPVLASTGQGSHVMLFAYFLILNLGIVAVALYKAWRPLNLTGFVFTFLIGLAWGLRSYRAEHFATTEPFLIAFFLLYVAVAVLFARNRAPELKKFVDGTIVFGTPLAAFGLQAGMLRNDDMGLAFSSLAAATFYIGLAAILHRPRRASWALLAECFLALGVVFGTLAIPLALDARWTSASWAFEGAAIVWIGIRQRQTLARYFGLALQIAAGAAYVNGYQPISSDIPFVDAPFIGAVLMALAGLFTHRKLLAARSDVTRFESVLVPFFFVWGLCWWLFAGLQEIDAHAGGSQVHWAVALFGATALALAQLSTRWEWHHAAVAARLLLPALAFFAIVGLFDNRHPFGRVGFLAWPFAIGVHVWILRRLEPETPGTWWRLIHAGAVWLVALLGAHELHWQAAHLISSASAWTLAAIAIPPAVLMTFFASHWADTRWPVIAEPRAYRATSPLLLTIALVFWSLYANTHSGRSDPLPYLPLLNALDLAHMLAAAAVISAVLAAGRTQVTQRSRLRTPGAAVVAGIITFIWLNGVLLRTLHHWADIPYTPTAMWHSVMAQAAISVFWAVLALALMVFAARKARRALWIVGAVLMAVVVAKLFLIDLSNVGGVARIVSFIAVGVLMLVIGYFSPVPPRTKTEKGTVPGLEVTT